MNEDLLQQVTILANQVDQLHQSILLASGLSSDDFRKPTAFLFPGFNVSNKYHLAYLHFCHTAKQANNNNQQIPSEGEMSRVFLEGAKEPPTPNAIDSLRNGVNGVVKKFGLGAPWKKKKSEVIRNDTGLAIDNEQNSETISTSEIKDETDSLKPI